MKRTPRAVQYAVAERLSHLDSAAWDELTADASVFVRRPFLTALEKARPANLSPRYALLYLEERPVAAVVLQLVRVEGRSAIAVNGPWGNVAQLVDERALVLGNLAAWGETGLIIAAWADADQRRLVWNESLRLVDRLRRFEKAEGSINVSFVRDATNDENPVALEQAGYQRAPGGPDMLLKCEASTFDDYLKKLASKRRRSVKKTIEDVEAAGYRLVQLDVPALERHAERIESLYAQVWANAEVRPLKLSGAFFVELKRRLADDCAIVGLEKNGKLDAFGVSLRSGRDAVGYYLGFEREVDAPLYLRLLINILENGFAWGARTISLGRTAEEPKARLGAEPGGTSLWVKHRTPPLNFAIGAILQSIEAPRIETHRVFKEN
ncbi:MAG: GNAT family N-acetyltransferase [Archangium sp.]